MTVLVPPRVAHGFENSGPNALRVLVIFPVPYFAETYFVDAESSSADERSERRSTLDDWQTAVRYRLAPLAQVTRGDRLESIHAGTIVVVEAGRGTVATVGSPETFAYFRSSAKPFQAIPVIESGAADAFGLTPAELALCCASHHAEPAHQEQVAVMLARIGLGPEHLLCGLPLPANPAEAARVSTGTVRPSPLHCDCSGKHAGMLAVCMHRGYPIDTYLDRDHPVQLDIAAVMSEMLARPLDDISLATDGCSLPTFGSTIASFARAYAALAAPETVDPGHSGALSRIRSAMTDHPTNVSGTNAFVSNLMALSDGRIVAKSGAEGLICFAVPEARLGIAIRVADGSFRAHPAIVIETLRQLGLMDEGFFDQLERHHPPTVRNHNGLDVGAIRPSFELSRIGV
jgi:L-asparaginase II